MKGWLITNRIEDNFGDLIPKTIGRIKIAYSKYDKFEKEQIFAELDSCMLITEGVLLNSCELISQHHQADLVSTLAEMFRQDASAALKALNGPFCGAYYDFAKEETLIFTNRVGDRPVYYYQDETGRKVASSNINMLIEFCHNNNLQLSFDKSAAALLLELGFVADCCTMAREIKRLFPGECMVWNKDGLQLKQYYMYDNTEDLSITMEDAVENVDRLFRQAVKRCFDKDLEYGYEHIADLSGGLDSRMTTWVARDMGYGPFTNLCWGMSGCEDFKIASDIAAYLGNDFFFQSIDGMHCFSDVDEATKRNYGAALYMGPTGALRFAKLINSARFGLKHSGLGGDNVIGSYVKEEQHRKPDNKSVLGYSDVDKCRVPYEKFANVEQAGLYLRSFLGTTNSNQLNNEFWPVVSPHEDNDLLAYCMRVPLKLRINKRLYIEWIAKKYPDALKFRRNGSIFSVYTTYKHFGFSNFFNRVYHRLQRDSQTLLFKLKLSPYRYRKEGMNPFEAVFERDPRQIAFMQDYFGQTIGEFSGDKDYKDYLTQRFKKGNSTQKAMVLTVLSFVKQHGIEVSSIGEEKHS